MKTPLDPNFQKPKIEPAPTFDSRTFVAERERDDHLSFSSAYEIDSVGLGLVSTGRVVPIPHPLRVVDADHRGLQKSNPKYSKKTLATSRDRAKRRRRKERKIRDLKGPEKCDLKNHGDASKGEKED